MRIQSHSCARGHVRVCVKAIIGSRMGPGCQDQRKLQPGVQDKPKTEYSVPIILWKVVMLGAGVGW